MKQDTEIHEDSLGSFADISFDRLGSLSLSIADRRTDSEGRRTHGSNYIVIADSDDSEDFARALRSDDSFEYRDEDGLLLDFDGERLSIIPGNITRSVGIDLDSAARIRFADFIQEGV